MAHTPGPWVMGYDPSTHEDALVSASGAVVAYAAWDGGSGCHLAIKNVADQQLIAAAPCLVDAGQEMLVAFAEGVAWNDEQRAAYEAFTAAIARATGADA